LEAFNLKKRGGKTEEATGRRTSDKFEGFPLEQKRGKGQAWHKDKVLV